MCLLSQLSLPWSHPVSICLFFSCSLYNTKSCVAVYKLWYMPYIYNVRELQIEAANRHSILCSHFWALFPWALSIQRLCLDQQGTPGSVGVLLLAGKADANQPLSVALDDRVPGAFVPADPLQRRVTHDLGNGAEHTLSKLEGNTKLGGVTDTPVTIQRVLNRLAKWAARNFIKFNKVKCKMPTLGRNKPVHQYLPLIWKQLCRKGPEGSGGHQVEREPAICPCSKVGWWCPGLH